MASVERQPMEAVFVVERNLAVKVLLNNFRRGRVCNDYDGRAYAFEYFEKNIQLVAAELIQLPLLILPHEREEFFLLRLPMYEQVYVLEMLIGRFSDFMHSLKEAVLRVDMPPDLDAGINKIGIRCDVAPEIESFGIKVLKFSITNDFPKSSRIERRIHSDE